MNIVKNTELYGMYIVSTILNQKLISGACSTPCPWQHPSQPFLYPPPFSLSETQNADSLKVLEASGGLVKAQFAGAPELLIQLV